MKENLYEIIKDFSKEKGLDHELVKKLVEQSLIQAAQRKLPYREIEGLKTVTGNLQKCDDLSICILQDTNGPDMIIPYSLISSANLEPLLKL